MAQQLRTPTTVAETLILFLCTRGLQLPLTPLCEVWYSLLASMGSCIHVEYTCPIHTRLLGYTKVNKEH